MKKLLIPLLCSLVAAWSCNFENSYYVENAHDIVTVDESQRLINDNGVVYTISENTSNLPALKEESRYYISFDILNQQFQIRLRSANPVDICTLEQLPAETEGLGQDPVNPLFSQASRYYLDLGISYYVASGSDYAHQIKFYYTLDNAESQLNIHVYHDGNGESPVSMEEKDLKLESKVISMPISQWVKTVNEIVIHFDVLVKDSTTGKYVTARREYTLR